MNSFISFVALSSALVCLTSAGGPPSLQYAVSRPQPNCFAADRSNDDVARGSQVDADVVCKNPGDRFVCLCFHPDHPVVKPGSNNSGNGNLIQKRARGGNGPVGEDFVPVCGRCQEDADGEKSWVPTGRRGNGNLLI